MATRHERKYRRLPGRNLTQHSLWLARDHILYVKKRAFSEEYKRFYLRDIQAVIVQKTASGMILNIIFGILALIMALLTYRYGGAPGSFMTAVFGGLFLVNLVLGPTCQCHIITAVQQDKLLALGRLGAAEKALKILSPLIRRAQRDLAVEES